jgi:hypothetical protein
MSEASVLRLFTLPIVLALAVGPAAGLVCQSVCRAETLAWSHCRDAAQEVQIRTLAPAACDTDNLVVAATPREETSRSVALPQYDDAVIANVDDAQQSLSARTRRSLTDAQRPPDPRPFSTVLRL